MAGRAKPQIRAKDLARYKLLKKFEKYLDKRLKGRDVAKTHLDPRRKMTQKVYLSALLFAMYNSVINSARGLCEASHIGRVQREISGDKISLGSFSEAQAVVEPELLREVFEDIVQERKEQRWGDVRLEKYEDDLVAIDGTVWPALARMPWAFYRNQGKKQNAVKLHVSFNILKQEPQDVVVRAAKKCERGVLRENLQKGAFYVADRYYGEDYQFFEELEKAGCCYLIRIRNDAVIKVVEELEVSQADRAAAVTSDKLVILGRKKKDQSKVIRLVTLQTQEGVMLLVTNKDAQELPGDLVSLIYRYRWQIELFFKWFKCILGCRHWFAQSQQGVTIQVYCVLIAAILLFRATGRKPSKRTMEMLQFYDMGYATFEELVAHLEREERKLEKKKT